MELYPYQKEAVAEMFKIMAYRVDLQSVANYETNGPQTAKEFFRFFSSRVSMPVGSGKTFIALEFLRRLITKEETLDHLVQRGPQMFYYNTTSKFIDCSLEADIPARDLSHKYLIKVPRTVATQWAEKAERFFGKEFFDKHVECIFSKRSFKHADRYPSKCLFIVADSLFRKNEKLINQMSIDVFIADEDKYGVSSWEFRPFFLWSLNADPVSPARLNSDIQKARLGHFFFSPKKRVVSTITLAELEIFLKLPPIKKTEFVFKQSRYFEVLKEEFNKSWSFLVSMSAVPSKTIKAYFESYKQKIRDEIEENNQALEVYKLNTPSEPQAKKAKQARSEVLLTLQNNFDLQINNLEKQTKQLESKLENLQYRLSAIECLVCLEEIADDSLRVIQQCCQNSCCLSCFKTLVANKFSTCPHCRASLDPTLNFLKKTLKNQDAPVQTPAAPLLPFQDVFRDIFYNYCHGPKILIVFALESGCPETELAALLAITDRNQSMVLTNQGGAVAIGANVLKFRNDPTIKTMFLNAAFCSFGLDLEFVDDVILFSNNFMPEDIKNQLLGRVQRNGRKSSVNIFYMIGK
mgnify:CR=1 FL=1